MLDKHNVNVPPHVVCQKVEVTVGSDANLQKENFSNFHDFNNDNNTNLHPPHHSVQWDVGVDRNHLWGEPVQSFVSRNIINPEKSAVYFLSLFVSMLGAIRAISCSDVSVLNLM